MKKVLPILCSVIYVTNVNGQRDNRRSYEVIGLPKGDEVFESLMVAIPLIIIGFLICYFTWWSKDAQKARENSSSTSSGKDTFGCIGFVILAVGGFFLLPLLTWFEFIAVNIMSLGIAIVVIGAIIFFIYSWITKK